MTKKSRSLFCALFFIILFSLTAQQGGPGQSEPPGAQPVNPRFENEQSIILNTGSPSGETESSQISTAWLFIRMILVLVLVIACIYGVVFFLKRGQRRQMTDDDPFLRRAASLVLAPGKSIQVITLGEEAYLIGVSDDAVSLISKINDKNLIDAMNLGAAENRAARTPRDFSSLLALLTGQKQQTPRASFSDSIQQTANFLRTQRGRLRRVETPEETERGK
ncbi:MAG: flagellar biosynthetic protein FliO [Treponema sp.]|jgi:flagellar protein FliO/FliZ|nr:flagellar biosynthetic protein FliO [Treponema sp.]